MGFGIRNMIRYHLYISLSPHLYMTSRQKLKYSPKKMKPSVADRKSGNRVYLNRYLLMEEDSGCVYLEYARDDRPESLYPFLSIQLEAPPPGFRSGSSIFRQVLTWRRVPYRSEFLNAFCSVPEIKDMLDTDQNMTKEYRPAAGGTYGDNHPLQRQTERSSRN